MPSTPALARPRAALAALISLLLVLTGVAAALPAVADAGTAARADVVAADADGIRVHVAASGLPADAAGAYVALIERGSETGVSGSGGYSAFAWVRAVSAGAFETELSAAAAGLVRGAPYEVIVWRQHSTPDAATILARADVTIADDRWDAVFGPVAPAEPEPAPEPTQPEPEPTQPAPEPTQPAPEPTQPAVTASVVGVSAADGVTVRVVGSGFGATAGAYAALIERGTEAGVSAGGGYAAFGFWMTPGAIVDGAFDKTLVAPAEKLDRAKAYEVIVWRGHSVPDATTIYARADVAIADAEWDALYPAAPRVTVSKATGLDPGGDTVTISGTGFRPNPPATSGGRPPLAGRFAGAYVVVGAFADVWQPSAGAPAAARAQAAVTKWGVLSEDTATIGGAARGAIAIAPDGTFSVTVPVAKDAAFATGNWGVYTYAGGGAVYAPFETFTPIAFRTPVPTGPEEPGPEQPAEPQHPSAAVAVDGGSLRWAVSSAFTSYVTGPIAKGRVEVVGGATATGERFQFGQAAPSAYDPRTDTGTVSYAGGVRFLGHGGALDLTFSAPEIRFTGPGSATLFLTSGGVTVPFATLSPGARIESNGAFTFTNVPATLTAAGSGLFQGNYPAGERLDPLTFTIGTPAAAPAGATGTIVATAAVAAAPAAPAPSAPPAAAAGACTVSGATLSWGFRESFRTYVEGIAGGGWQLADVAYAYPRFVWSGGSGTVDEDGTRGLVSHGGSIRFTGHDGALDTTLANARIELAGDAGYLVFDVTGTTQDGAPVAQKDVRLAQFARDAAQAAGGTITLASVPATLTDAGSAAFGTYPAGTALDPVSATIPVDPGCGVVATTGGASVAAAEAPAEAAMPLASEGGSLAWLWILAVVVLAGIVAVVWIVVARRA